MAGFLPKLPTLSFEIWLNFAPQRDLAPNYTAIVGLGGEFSWFVRRVGFVDVIRCFTGARAGVQVRLRLTVHSEEIYKI